MPLRGHGVFLLRERALGIHERVRRARRVADAIRGGGLGETRLELAARGARGGARLLQGALRCVRARRERVAASGERRALRGVLGVAPEPGRRGLLARVLGRRLGQPHRRRRRRRRRVGVLGQARAAALGRLQLLSQRGQLGVSRALRLRGRAPRLRGGAFGLRLRRARGFRLLLRGGGAAARLLHAALERLLLGFARGRLGVGVVLLDVHALPGSPRLRGDRVARVRLRGLQQLVALGDLAHQRALVRVELLALSQERLVAVETLALHRVAHLRDAARVVRLGLGRALLPAPGLGDRLLRREPRLADLPRGVLRLGRRARELRVVPLELSVALVEQVEVVLEILAELVHAAAELSELGGAALDPGLQVADSAGTQSHELGLLARQQILHGVLRRHLGHRNVGPSPTHFIAFERARGLESLVQGLDDTGVVHPARGGPRAFLCHRPRTRRGVRRAVPRSGRDRAFHAHHWLTSGPPRKRLNGCFRVGTR